MSGANRHLSEDELTLFHYGELEGHPGAELHLVDCAACRGSYAELTAVLATVETLPVPDRGDGYGAEVWERLSSRIAPREQARPVWRRPWAAAAMLLLALAGAFVAGRISIDRAPGDTALAPIPEAARARILRAAVGEHLERSSRMLLEIANRGEGLDPETLEGDARGLLGSNRLYRQSLSAAGQRDLLRLLEDLERVLLDIAHSPDEGEDGLEPIRERIEERGLLFKVRIVISRLRQQERSASATGTTYPQGETS